MVDLFCGGGGSSTGYHMAGFETTVAVDFMEHCVRTFNLNYPNTAIQRDISILRSEVLLEKGGKPDFVTASPPCEPFTSANNKRIVNPFDRMFSDDIGRLMIHAIRLIADLDPKFFMIENVVGIFDGDGKQLLADEFNRLGLGNVHFNVIQAEQWGVPSLRQRAIITNFPIKIPYLPSKRLLSAISDLPPPNYPHEYEYHITPTIPDGYAKKIPGMPQGDGLVHFHGAVGQMRNYLRPYGDKISPVVMGKSKFVHPLEDRMLTPQEHARLMTFPDDYKYWGSMEQIYDIIGEAVPPKLTYEIGKQVMKLY